MLEEQRVLGWMLGPVGLLGQQRAEELIKGVVVGFKNTQPTISSKIIARESAVKAVAAKPGQQLHQSGAREKREFRSCFLL